MKSAGWRNAARAVHWWVMTEETLRRLLESVRAGNESIDDAVARLRDKIAGDGA